MSFVTYSDHGSALRVLHGGNMSPSIDKDNRPVKHEDEIAGPTSGETSTVPDPVRSTFDRGVVWCARG
ncbi:hypothetical protein BIS07_16680, partial [Halomonas sp. FL8]|nr:hypothetical protein [Halomonas sp. FL8]MCP1361246.1 hypothetical protein [Halomonas sp. BBD45]